MRFSLLLVVASALYTSATNPFPPRITKQPPTDELLFQVAEISQSENEKPFIIECEADGEPEPEYHWIKNGKEYNYAAYDDRILKPTHSGTLVISHPRDEDLGQYQCFANNTWGRASSNSVFVRKAELNEFKDEPPKDMMVNEGEPFQLTCAAPDGWPKPEVYWMHQGFDGNLKTINNSRMTLDPEGSLWFSNVTRQDASNGFYYACSARSVYRGSFKTGNRINLIVLSSGASAAQNKYPPKRQFVTRRNEVAIRGTKAELFCIFGGTPLPETIWMKNGVRVQPNERVTQGHYGKSIVIKRTEFEDEGIYTCEVSNGVGQAASYSIDFQVQAKPYFTVEPEEQTKAEGESAEFRCEASGIPEPKIKWIYNGEPLEKAAPNPRIEISANRITIHNLVKTDTGNYGCNATNSIGYVYKDVSINVLALRPDIAEAPTNISTVDGKTVNMTCVVTGSPRPQVKWIRSGQELTGGRYKTLPTGDLQITNVNFGDAGTYTCHASNKLGQAEASADLIVKEHTKIIEVPEDYEVVAGDTATFRCNAVTDTSLTLTINWLRNDETLDVEVEPRFIVTSDYSLSITKTHELDSGIYSCVATTELDEVREQATLIVQDVPNPVVQKDPDCQATKAQVSWEPKGDNRAPILRYEIQTNTSFTPDAWEVAFDSIPATEQTFAVPMSPWANYTFRVIAYNIIGPSVPSAHSLVCKTQPAVPTKNPSNVMGNGTTPNNIVISWTVMPKIDHNGDKFIYRVNYKRDIPGQEWIQHDIHDWRINRLEINNEPTYERYLIKVVAINEIGESSAPPKIVVGYSGENQPTAAPKNLQVESVEQGVQSSTTAILSWSPVPLDTVNGELRGYKVQTWTAVGNNNNVNQDDMREILVPGVNTTRVVINKFVPYKMNFVRVLAYNGRYNGPASEIKQFQTHEGVPGTVLSLDAFSLGSSALWLMWTRPAESNGVLTGYRIYYQVVNGTELGPLLERQPHVKNPYATSAKLASLKPQTKYRVHIRATTNTGEGVPYYIEETTQGSRKPDLPEFTWENVLTSNGYATVRINWLTNSYGYPGSHFFVTYKVYHHPHMLQTDPEFQDHEIIIRGLQQGETYEMRVIAVDGEYMTASNVRLVETSDDGPIIQPMESTIASEWFISLLLMMILLIVALVLVCMARRHRGGKYASSEREFITGRNDYPEDHGFSEYSQPLDTKSSGGRASAASSSRNDGKHDSDEDSITGYQEGDAADGMNEDGSFIGQYGRKKRAPNPQAFATVV